jgi:hypothetical protein
MKAKLNHFPYVLTFVILGCTTNKSRIEEVNSIVNGDTISVVTHFNRQGYKEAVIYYKNSLTHGLSETYFNEGTLKQQKSFYNDKIFGSYIEYNPNQTVAKYSFLVDSIHNSYERIYNPKGGLVKINGDPMACYKVVSSNKSQAADSIIIRIYFSFFGLKKMNVVMSEDNKEFKPLFLTNEKDLPYIKIGLIKSNKKANKQYIYYINMTVLDENDSLMKYSDVVSFESLK